MRRKGEQVESIDKQKRVLVSVSCTVYSVHGRGRQRSNEETAVEEAKIRGVREKRGSWQRIGSKLITRPTRAPSLCMLCKRVTFRDTSPASVLRRLLLLYTCTQTRRVERKNQKENKGMRILLSRSSNRLRMLFPAYTHSHANQLNTAGSARSYSPPIEFVCVCVILLILYSVSTHKRPLPLFPFCKVVWSACKALENRPSTVVLPAYCRNDQRSNATKKSGSSFLRVEAKESGVA